VHQAEFNHTVLHGQKLSFDLAQPNPPSISRPLVVPKSNHPPIIGRPNSAASKASPHEPVKVYGTPPPPSSRPGSATPGGANRSVKDDICLLYNRKFYFSSGSQDRKLREVNRKPVIAADKERDIDKRRKELAKQAEERDKQAKKDVCFWKNRFYYSIYAF
jgi:hypothetical protein